MPYKTMGIQFIPSINREQDYESFLIASVIDYTIHQIDVGISKFEIEHSSFEPARTSPLQSGHTLLNTVIQGDESMSKMIPRHKNR